MTLSETPGAFNHFRKICWKFQQTFFKERKTQPVLAAAIVSGHEPFQAGRIIVDEFIFEPRNLKVFLGASSLPPWNGHDGSLETTRAFQQIV
jgi:hypothetical protein